MKLNDLFNSQNKPIKENPIRTKKIARKVILIISAIFLLIFSGGMVGTFVGENSLGLNLVNQTYVSGVESKVKITDGFSKDDIRNNLEVQNISTSKLLGGINARVVIIKDEASTDSVGLKYNFNFKQKYATGLKIEFYRHKGEDNSIIRATISCDNDSLWHLYSMQFGQDTIEVHI